MFELGIYMYINEEYKNSDVHCSYGIHFCTISSKHNSLSLKYVFLSLSAVHCVGDCGICTSNYWWNTSLHIQRGG